MDGLHTNFRKKFHDPLTQQLFWTWLVRDPSWKNILVGKKPIFDLRNMWPANKNILPYVSSRFSKITNKIRNSLLRDMWSSYKWKSGFQFWHIFEIANYAFIWKFQLFSMGYRESLHFQGVTYNFLYGSFHINLFLPVLKNSLYGNSHIKYFWKCWKTWNFQKMWIFQKFLFLNKFRLTNAVKVQFSEKHRKSCF